MKEKGRSYRGEMLHEKVEQALHCLSFSDSQITKISTYAKEELSKTVNYRTVMMNSKVRDFKEVAAMIEKLERKMINDEIEASTYKVWFARLNAEKAALENDIYEFEEE